MRRGIIIGTAGHVDHGKTALVRALTGVETDRWAEERERGLTIDIGFAPFEDLAGCEAGIVDVPGHEDFVKNMLAGSTGIDLLLLVVAADEGPMPQTREHLTIARLLGVLNGVVALNKADRVEAEWLDLVRETTRDEVNRLTEGLDWPIVDVSAVTGQGLEELRRAIGEAAARPSVRDPSDLFRMPVDRSFTVPGAGTVVTGTTWSGRVGAGETVRLLPVDQVARVRSLQVHGESREQVGPGRRCAIALVGVDSDQVGRGSVVLGQGGWRPLNRLGARVEVIAESPHALSHGQRVRLFLGTDEVMARVRTVDRKTLTPGGVGWVVLDCERPVVARAGDRFILRFYSPVSILGGGQVCALDPPRGWRSQVEAWGAILDGSPSDAISAAVDAAGGEGRARDELPLATRLTSAMAEEILAGTGGTVRLSGKWYGEAALRGAEAAVLKHLEEAHERRRRLSSEPLESVRAGLSRKYSPELVNHVVGVLEARGKVVVDGPGIRLAGHEADLSGAEREASEALEAILATADLAPPSPGDLAGRLGLDRDVLNDLLKLLVESGRVVRVTPEVFLTREAEARARETIRDLTRFEAVAPAGFREALGLTRKHLIPLLEHMDRMGVTKRTPEGRIAIDGGK
ncbi:MAG: selenocysteine-specific translation elongation factor [Candidatus Palauibacterales bacterium]|nr:selenocysteine-specific translation elongation factor [Candidatus Palauibacterales bacterium]MDP2481712.1 selenocysteine-specific translation elongation factor [Candidatus Palauibacterales bacterium]